jgi:hypothetical protein
VAYLNAHLPTRVDRLQSPGPIIVPSLSRLVIFAATSAAAEAIAQTDVERAILSSIEDDRALVWLMSPDGPIHTLRFDACGRITRDASFTLASLTLRIAAGARIEGGDDDNPYVIIGDENALTFGSGTVEGGRIEIGQSGSPEAGRLSFSATLSGQSVSASLRYFYRAQSGSLAGFEYPVFSADSDLAQSVDSILVEASIDPIHPADATRNRFVIKSTASTKSNFVSVSGDALTLAIIPDKSAIANQWDPVQQQFYSVPMGDWRLDRATGPSGPTGDIPLMCGISGLEYANVRDGSVVRFVPNAPAFAPFFLNPSATGATQSLTDKYPGSTLPVCTSWMYFSDDGPVGGSAPVEAPAATGPVGAHGYYSQPERGGLFSQDITDPFLQVLQLQTASFPPGTAPVFGAPQASFPMVPYAGVRGPGPTFAQQCTQFEVEVLSTTRSNAIFAMNWPTFEAGPAGLAAPHGGDTGLVAPTGPLAVTPQGMLSTFSTDYSVWERLILATTGNGDTLELRGLCQQLRAALLTNQLFLVISNITALQECCTVLFPNLRISDWQFNLHPERWRDDTVMVLKFAQQSLADLVKDRSLWSAPGSSFNDGAATQAILLDSIAEAEKNADQPEFQYFLNTVLQNWNGIIFFNCDVPPGDLPPELRGLVAGIDIQQFKAHHLGVNLSPVKLTAGKIEITDSSLFGLIYYEDAEYLVFQSKPYDFKVLYLRVLFANSEISSFSSQIQLLVAELFGERSSLAGSDQGDNLILNGVMQKQGDKQSYSFTKQGTDVFTIESHVLDTVDISQAQFVTLPEDETSDLITSQFLLWGRLKYKQLPEFDLFSFGPSGATGSEGPAGGLQFSNLMISMASGSTSPTGPTGPSGPADQTRKGETTFAFEAGQMVFDPGSSSARPQSLYSRFPLQVVGMLQGNAQTLPADLGYIAMDTPLPTGALGDPWFGLQMSLSLGSQGSLAPKANFTATLLAAWAPSTETYNVAVAIQLPGSQRDSKTLIIEGPLQLSIDSLALLENKEQQAYLMRFANIALSIFGVKFPPGGRTNLLLFGDPNPKAANTTLGWYAAYAKNPSKTGPTGSTGPAPRALPEAKSVEKDREMGGCGGCEE